MPLAIWLSLVLVGLAVSGWSLSLLWACKPVSVLLGDQFSSGRVCAQKVWNCLAPRCKWQPEGLCPSCSTDRLPCVLLAGPLQRGGADLTSMLRSESAAGRSLSPGGLCTEGSIFHFYFMPVVYFPTCLSVYHVHALCL